MKFLPFALIIAAFAVSWLGRKVLGLATHQRFAGIEPASPSWATPIAIISALIIAAFASPVMARDNDAWEEMTPQIRKWFQGLMQPDNPNISCCGESDGYFADSFEVKGDQYIAIITDTRDVPGRPTIAPGTKIVVPNQKLKYDAGNPTGHGVIFVKYDEEAEAFTVYCYIVPPGV